MPKRYARKQTGRRRKRRKYSGALVRKSPMPIKFCTKLRYSDYMLLDPGATGITGVNVFSANSLYDPDRTNAGHQPRGFDQLIQFYDHYTVIGAQITATFSMTDSNTYAQIAGVCLRDGVATDNDPNDYLEQGTVRSAVVQKQSGGGNSKVLTMRFSPKKFLGRSKPLADSQLKGSSSSSPSEEAFFHCFTAPMESVNAGAVSLYVVIDYIAVFTEPKDIAQS